MPLFELREVVWVQDFTLHPKIQKHYLYSKIRKNKASDYVMWITFIKTM